MQRLVVVAIIAGLVWYGYGRYQARGLVDAVAPASSVATAAPAAGGSGTGSFRCDGRIHCSQMTSCTEATYFLRNCPGTKMDGDNDGVPCETQWCR